MRFNKVIIIGRLTADPELKMTQSGLAVTSFSVAVDRRFAKESDEVKADFFNVVCWRKTAEFVCNYFSKGKEILVEGELQNRSYTANDGGKRTVTEIVAGKVNFVGGKNDGALLQSENSAQYRDQAPLGAVAASSTGGTPAQNPIGGTPGGNFEEVGEEDDLPF